MRILFAVSVFVFALIIMGCGAEPTPTPSAPTATPTPIPRVSAQTLFNERDSNAVRFDAQRKDKWITVYGRIERIESESVYLRVDGLMDSMRLNDLSEAEIIRLDKGQRFEATCVVGLYVLGTMFLNDCRASG